MKTELDDTELLKDRYKMTKKDDIVKCVKALCAWRGLATRKEKLDYLVKLLNDNLKNQLYLDIVPSVVKHLGAKLETESVKYIAVDAKK